jgi:hypothetical protein
MGNPDCTECEDCKGTQTCFEDERHNVSIDGDKGTIDGYDYTVETSDDAYRLFPVDPTKPFYKSDHLTITRSTGAYIWLRDSTQPFRSGWHYEEGTPGVLQETLGCHAVKQLF